MTMSMREKMAKSMAIKAGINPDEAVVLKNGKQGKSYWTYMALADAALDALQTPTEEMSHASLGPEIRDENGIRCFKGQPNDYHVMIRAAKSGA